MLLLGWDFETFGNTIVSIAAFSSLCILYPMNWPVAVSLYTASEMIERHRDQSYHLPLPTYPTTWAGSGGIEVFLGDDAQKNILQLMGYVYNMARLTDNPDLLIWLSGSHNPIIFT